MEIVGKEIIAAEGKYVARKGSDIYFTRGTLLKGEKVEDFVEITADGKERREASGNIGSVRTAKIEEISEYDKSDAVNSFVYDGVPMWFGKADRVGLMNSLHIEKNAGRKESTMWFGDVPMVVNIDEGIALLNAVELYALECYNVTARHKADVNALETEEEIEAYDYTAGYPEKLVFNFKK